MLKTTDGIWTPRTAKKNQQKALVVFIWTKGCNQVSYTILRFSQCIAGFCGCHDPFLEAGEGKPQGSEEG